MQLLQRVGWKLGVFSFISGVLGLVWLAQQFWFWIAAVAVCLALAWLGRWAEKEKLKEAAAEWERERAVRDEARRRLWSIIDDHAEELARARLQLIRRDRYGLEDRTAWDKELGYFAEKLIRPALSRFSDDVVRIVLTSEMPDVERTLIALAEGRRHAMTFSPTMSAAAYERLCSDILQQAGWDARTTKGSGDQGVDVIATKGPHRLVLQCKLYSGSVGNGAVQEAAAAKLHERATAAAVVSNSTFTPAARQLAGTTGTLLLHHEQLTGLEELLTRSQGSLAG